MKKQLIEALIDEFGSDQIVETIAQILLERAKEAKNKDLKEKLEIRSHIYKDATIACKTI
jgi:hypothetical protein